MNSGKASSGIAKLSVLGQYQTSRSVTKLPVAASDIPGKQQISRSTIKFQGSIRLPRIESVWAQSDFMWQLISRSSIRFPGAASDSWGAASDFLGLHQISQGRIRFSGAVSDFQVQKQTSTRGRSRFTWGMSGIDGDPGTSIDWKNKASS